MRISQYRLNLYRFAEFKSIELKLIYILLLLLLFFGRSFTKISVIGPLHAYDMALISLTAFVVIRNGIIMHHFKGLLIMILISIVYLLISFGADNPVSMIIRQYALFAYIIISFFLVFCLVRKSREDVLYLIKNISLLAVISQGLFTGFAYISGSSPVSYSDKLYLSPLTIMGVITALAYVLVMVPKSKIVIRIVLTFLILIICLLTGHASAFLSAIVVLFLYLFLHLHPIYRGVSFAIFLTLLIILNLYSVEANDSNASWRVIYWNHSLDVILQQNFLLFGEGFGVKYAPDAVITEITQQIGADHLGEENNAYLTPVHNSFLTIFFHIGLVPGLIIIVPIIVAFFKRLFNPKERSPAKDFILLNVIGLSVWSSFNVILELPHSSLYYWINYFTLYYLFENHRIKYSSRKNKSLNPSFRKLEDTPKFS